MSLDNEFIPSLNTGDNRLLLSRSTSWKQFIPSRIIVDNEFTVSFNTVDN